MGHLDLTSSWAGYSALAVFIVAYALVVLEEFTHLRKSKPVVFAAGLIWAIIGLEYLLSGQSAHLDEAGTRAVEALVDRYRGEHEAPIIWVAHDGGQLARVASRRLHLEGGRLEQPA